MSEERKRILRMVAEGKLTPEEADELLAALESQERGEEREVSYSYEFKAGTSRRPRWLRVQVTDTRTGKTRVNVNVPFKLVELGSKLGGRWVGDIGGVSIDEILAAVAEGENGKIVEVEDEESGEHVVVYVE